MTQPKTSRMSQLFPPRKFSSAAFAPWPIWRHRFSWRWNLHLTHNGSPRSIRSLSSGQTLVRHNRGEDEVPGSPSLRGSESVSVVADTIFLFCLPQRWLKTSAWIGTTWAAQTELSLFILITINAVRYMNVSLFTRTSTWENTKH